MTTPGVSIEQLLRWRQTRAEADAPPPPNATRLLELARPWWEAWPERYAALVQRLGTIQVAYGYALAEPQLGRPGHPVPTLIAQAEELETFAHVLYLSAHDGWLRLRFQLDATPARAERSYDVTLVSEPDGRPLLSAFANVSVDNEYRLDAVLSDALGTEWGRLRATDRMPFRLILHPVVDGA